MPHFLHTDTEGSSWKYVWKYFLIFTIKKSNYWSSACDMSKLFFSKFVAFPECLCGFHLHWKEISRLSHLRSCLCYSLWIPSDPHIHIFIQAQSTSKMLNITREACHTLQKDLRLVFQVCILTSKDYKTVCIKH